MDSGSNVYGDYGESFLEGFMNSSSDTNIPSTAEPQFTGGVDILQQSLKAADILDNGSNASFDDFGFMFNNDSYNNNNGSNLDAFQASSPANLYFSEQSETQTPVSNDTFNADDFLNIPTTSKLSVASAERNTLQVDSSTFNFDTSTSNILHSKNPSQKTLSSSCLSNLVTLQQPNPVNASQSGLATQVPVQSLPLAQIQLQIPANKATTLTRRGQASTTNHLYQNTQYVVSGSQSVSQFSTASYSTCTSTTLQSNSVSVCGTTFTRVLQQPISVPVVIRSRGQSSQTLVNSSSISEPLKQYLPSAGRNPQLNAVTNREEQTNKIALILRTKAAQQSAAGNTNILRVGDQNIDISDPAVVKALATKIYEQRLRQQTQNQPSSASSMFAQPHTTNPVLNRSGINISGVQNKVIVTTPQQQPRVKTEYVYSLPQNVVQNHIIRVEEAKTVLPTNSGSTDSVKPASVIQLASAKPNNSVPLNRIQIASVNVPLPSSQPSSGNGTVQRPIPIRIITNVTPSTMASHPQVQVLRAAPSPNGPNHVIQPITSGLKLSTSQPQADILTNEQIQKIQHQVGLQERKSASPVFVNQFKTSTNGSSTSSVLPQPAVVASQGKAAPSKVVVFRVDPNLTLQQVEQVQQLILKKAIPPNSSPLTVEQKQLLSAFRAQLRTMDQPIQQYYLRNPQLFLLKVYQHLQTGRPYVFQAKIEQTTTTKSSAIAASLATTQHPTISLTQGGGHLGKVQTLRINRASSPIAASQPRKAPKRAAKESFPEPASVQLQPPKRPSLLMEQLRKHREMVGAPGTDTAFVTVRDACRKLLPYHVYNTPKMEEESFDDSEPFFDQISDGLVTKQMKMLNKYHMLCLRESTKEVCSADVVMLERSYLQHERSMFAELKKQIKDDPGSIRNHLPPSQADTYPELLAYFKERSRLKAPPAASHPQKISGQFTAPLGRSSPGPSEAGHISPRTMQGSMEAGANKESLLREAVESILS